MVDISNTIFRVILWGYMYEDKPDLPEACRSLIEQSWCFPFTTITMNRIGTIPQHRPDEPGPSAVCPPSEDLFRIINPAGDCRIPGTMDRNGA
jgi:hypothetical protein